MWLISNPLFEIGAGLVLIAATVWMLLNATAPRPAAARPTGSAVPPPPAPLPSAPPPSAPPPSAPPIADPVPALGPLTPRAARTMYLADDEETASPVPPLRLTPEPPPPPLPVVATPPSAVEPPAPAVPAEERPAPDPLPPVPPPEEPEPPPAPMPVEVLQTPHPPSAAPLEIAQPEEPAIQSPALLAPMAEEPPVTPPDRPFETRFREWLDGLLQPAAGAPSSATVTAAAARMKRSVDPDWPEPARDLRATIECLGKIAPAVFATAAAREATARLAEAVGPPFALIWPEVGDAFDPVRHEARSGEGDVVVSVVRPGAAYGDGGMLPALVVRGSASPSSANA